MTHEQTIHSLFTLGYVLKDIHFGDMQDLCRRRTTSLEQSAVTQSQTMGSMACSSGNTEDTTAREQS